MVRNMEACKILGFSYLHVDNKDAPITTKIAGVYPAEILILHNCVHVASFLGSILQFRVYAVWFLILQCSFLSTA